MKLTLRLPLGLWFMNARLYFFVGHNCTRFWAPQGKYPDLIWGQLEHPRCSEESMLSCKNLASRMVEGIGARLFWAKWPKLKHTNIFSYLVREDAWRKATNGGDPATRGSQALDPASLQGKVLLSPPASLQEQGVVESTAVHLLMWPRGMGCTHLDFIFRVVPSTVCDISSTVMVGSSGSATYFCSNFYCMVLGPLLWWMWAGFSWCCFQFQSCYGTTGHDSRGRSWVKMWSN
jgi:hypothetical protein